MRRRSALRGRDRRQGVLSVLASSTGRVGTDLTRAWIRRDGPWTGEMEPRERSFPSPKLPPSLEPEFGHPPPRRNRGLSFLTSGAFSNKPGHKYHSSQPVRRVYSAATAETRRTQKHNRGLNRPTNQSRARPPALQTLQREGYSPSLSRISWALDSLQRGLSSSGKVGKLQRLEAMCPPGFLGILGSWSSWSSWRSLSFFTDSREKEKSPS